AGGSGLAAGVFDPCRVPARENAPRELAGGSPRLLRELCCGGSLTASCFCPACGCVWPVRVGGADQPDCVAWRSSGFPCNLRLRGGTSSRPLAFLVQRHGGVVDGDVLHYTVSVCGFLVGVTLDCT